MVGQAGVTNITVTGSGFPSGSIPAANVSVTLKPANAGPPTGTTAATAVTTVVGSTRRISFTIPAAIVVSLPTTYAVSVAGTTSDGTAFSSGNTAALTVNPSASISSVTPDSGQAGQTLPVSIAGLYTNFVQGSTQASFGPGISVGGASPAAFGPVTVTTPTTATAQLSIDPSATLGSQTVTIQTGAQQESLQNGFTIKPASGTSPVITDFNPKSAVVGTLINISGSNFTSTTAAMPQLTLGKQGGGSIAAPVATFDASHIAMVIPAGAATGLLTVTVGIQSATSTGPLTINPPSTFSLTAVPSSANLIQGQSAAYAVSLSTSSGFNQLAALTVTGLPQGVTASFNPLQITAGQTSILTVTASPSLPDGASTLSVTAAATVGGIPVAQSASPVLNVMPMTTSFLGRTVVSDTVETPLGGVTVTMLGKDGNGGTTGCTGTTVSDAAGNFLVNNLSALCIGPQLVGFDGTTVTSPQGKYSGVNLAYTFSAGQVTISPVLVHLPRIDNQETFLVKQNAATDQSHSYNSIPGLSVTVYAGTIFTMQDGTKPDPFPLVAVNVPVDRLADAKPNVPTMLRSFLTAFQPENAATNQPVAVYYPNVINTPPGANMALMTLDPTRGQMVPYGTGTVSADGKQIVPDPDPAHSGHLYGLVHFDWNGILPPPPPGPNPSPSPDPDPGPGPGPNPDCPGCCAKTNGNGPPQGNGSGPQGGDPVDLSSGLQIVRSTDIAINGLRGPISINRIYRTLSANPGPFGIGTGHNYGYQLNDANFIKGQPIIMLIMPDGNQYPFNLQPNGTLTNSQVPSLRSSVMTSPSFGIYSLRLSNGTIYRFQSPSTGPFVAYLNSITDPNGNVVTLARGNPLSPIQITQVIDPVGRSLTITYDSSDRITSITDPVGRTVSYRYNSQGTLATVTDPGGGVTSYTYDSQGHLVQITDPRGVVVAQDTYDVNGRVIQQVQADGGVIKFAYTLLNPLAPSSPVLLTAATDAMGNTTTYHFDLAGFLLDVTDPIGQKRVFTRDAQHSNLVTAVTGTGSCPVCGSTSIGDLTFTYDSDGNLATKKDSLGNTRIYTYETAFNKVTSSTDPVGGVTRFTYDARGNQLTTTDPGGNTTSFTYNSIGQITQTADALGQTTSYSYDTFGNLITITDPLGSISSIVYDAVSRPVQFVDALGRKTAPSYDAFGRIVTMTNPQGNKTQFTYDQVGSLLSATDENGKTTSFTYNAMNRLKTRIDPLGKSDTRTYDFAGNLVKFVDRRGQTSVFTYDALNRLTGQVYQDGSTGTGSYDANGRVVRVADSVGGTFEYAYDSTGSVIIQTDQFGTVQYAHDAASRVVSRQVVGQSAVTYSYDGAGNLRSASMPQGGASFTYNARNQALSLTRSNGVSSQYTYDAAGELLSIAHSGGQDILTPLNYSYDPVGERSLYTTNFTSPQAVTNSFDIGGRLVQSGSTSYAYDDNGNLISATDTSGTTSYVWDTRNRLQSISDPSGQKTTFLYDYDTNLIAQTDSGPALNLAQYFVLDRTNVAFLGRSNGDSLSVLAGRAIDQHLAVVHANGQVEYGLSDAANSTIATVDQSGKLISSFSYEPFGKTTTTSNYPFQFAGRLPLAGSLCYFRARELDSRAGRFISEDPVSVFRGGKAYPYAGNSPLTLSDATGLFDPGPDVGGCTEKCIKSHSFSDETALFCALSGGTGVGGLIKNVGAKLGAGAAAGSAGAAAASAGTIIGAIGTIIGAACLVDLASIYVSCAYNCTPTPPPQPPPSGPQVCGPGQPELVQRCNSMTGCSWWWLYP
jgi:RHS repeat-associated protein